MKILENAWFDFFELGMTQKKIATPILLPVTTCSTLVSRTTPWVSAMSCDQESLMFVDIVWCSLPEPLILVLRSDIHLLSMPMTPVDLSICYELVPMGAKPTIKGYAIFKQFASVLFPPTHFPKGKAVQTVGSPIPSRRKIAPTFVSTHLFHSKICKKE